MQDYSIKNISPKLLGDVREAIESVESFGSVEIYIQNGYVSQISIRHIKKTSATLPNGNGVKAKFKESSVTS
jgi:hypothetical protein